MAAGEVVHVIRWLGMVECLIANIELSYDSFLEGDVLHTCSSHMSHAVRCNAGYSSGRDQNKVKDVASHAFFEGLKKVLIRNVDGYAFEADAGLAPTM